MKKQLILTFALLISVITFAQKKEVKALEKAVKNNNYAEAKTLATQLEGMVSQMDDKLKNKFLINKAKTFYANGGGDIEDVDVAINTLSNVDGMEAEVKDLKSKMQNSILEKSNKQYTSGDFEKASKGFESLYRIMPKDTTYLYYAASSAVSGQDYDTALKHYEKLNELGYTGIEKQYYATNAEGKEEVMSKSQRDIFVKSGTYTNPGERITESKAAEIIKNIAMIYMTQGKDDKALAAIKKARKYDSKNVNLLTSEANLYYKLGDVESYKVLIEEAIQLDPNNSDLFFNLGVLANDSNDISRAKEYYKKAIKINPENVNALTNLAALILSQEKAIVTEMNNLGSSAADNAKYDALKLKRQDIYTEAIPYLESVLVLKPNDIDILKTLMSIYSAKGETDKYKELKAKVEQM
ncbi:tetratricopeptide repeat protein [Lacinutrix salivirga]